MVRNSATMLPVASAICETAKLAPVGIGPSLLPPLTARKALFVFSFSGLTTTNQCSQSGRSTSLLSRQVCEVSRMMNVVDGLPLMVLATFQPYAASGFWTYSSSGVRLADAGGLAPAIGLATTICNTVSRIMKVRIGYPLVKADL